jgi:hypothetical protein
VGKRERLDVARRHEDDGVRYGGDRIPDRRARRGARAEEERRAVDFGGCRCQAFHLTGDAAATDPACSLAPRHDVVVQARAEPAASLRYRAPGA